MADIQWEDESPSIQWEDAPDPQGKEFNASLPSNGYSDRTFPEGHKKPRVPTDSYRNFNDLKQPGKFKDHAFPAGMESKIAWEDEPKKPVPESNASAANPNPLGVLDFGASLISGAAGAAVGGFAGAADLAVNRDLKHAVGASQAVSEALTWEPRTQHGKNLAQGFQHGMEAVKGAMGEGAVEVGRAITGDKSWDPAMQTVGEAWPDVAMTALMMPKGAKADIGAPDVNVTGGKNPTNKPIVPGEPEAALQPDAPLAGTPDLTMPFRPSEQLFKQELESSLEKPLPYEEVRQRYKETYPDNLFADKPRTKLGQQEQTLDAPPSKLNADVQVDGLIKSLDQRIADLENSPAYKSKSFTQQMEEKLPLVRERSDLQAQKAAGLEKETALRREEELKAFAGLKDEVSDFNRSTMKPVEAPAGWDKIEKGFEQRRPPQEKAPSFVREVTRNTKHWERGALTAEQFAQNMSEALIRKQSAELLKPEPERARGVAHVRARLYSEAHKGNIDLDVADFSSWLLDKNPAIANQLGIAIKQSPEGTTARGNYSPETRIVRLFTDKTLTPDVAVHEILHHASGFFKDDVVAGLQKEWIKTIAEHAEFLSDVRQPVAIKGANGKTHFVGMTPKEAAAWMVDNVMTGKDYGINQQIAVSGIFGEELMGRKGYHLTDPNEFFAVRGTDVLKRRWEADTWQAKAKTFLIEMFEKIRGILGLSDAPVIKALNAMIKDDMYATHSKKLLGKKVGVLESKDFTDIKDISKGYDEFVTNVQMKYGPEKLEDANAWWTEQVQKETAKADTTAESQRRAVAGIPGLRNTRNEVGTLEGVLKNDAFTKDGIPKYTDISKPTRHITGELEKPDYFKTRNPVLRWAVDKLNAAEHNARFNADKLLYGTQWAGRSVVGTSKLLRDEKVGMTLANRLPIKEQVSLKEAMLKYEQDVKFGPSNALAQLNPKQAEALQNYRDMMDKTWTEVNAAYKYLQSKHPAAAKAMEDTFRGAYIPHAWMGEYRWNVMDQNGKRVATHSTTGYTATLDKMGLQKRYPKNYKFEMVQSEDFVPGYKAHLEERMPQEMGGFMGTKPGWKGAKDLWNASELYVRQAARQAEMFRLQADYLDLMDKKSPYVKQMEKHYPNTLDWTRSYIKDYIFTKQYGAIEKLIKAAGTITGKPSVGLGSKFLENSVSFGNNVFLASVLGWSPRMWFGNTVQPITQINPFLLQEVTRLGLKDKSMVDHAMLKGAQDFFTAFNRRNEALRYGYESGALHPKFVEALDYEKTGVHNFNDLKNKWGHTTAQVALGKTTSAVTEEWGRGLAYLTAVNFYEAAGFKGPAAYKLASEATNMYAGRYGRHQQPQALSQDPTMAAALSPLHTYMHTLYGQTGEFVRRAKEKGEYRPLMNHLGYVTAMGGITGSVGIGLADQITDLLNEKGHNLERPSTKVINMAEENKRKLQDLTGSKQLDKFVDSYVNGLPAAWLDWDVQGSLEYPSMSETFQAGGMAHVGKVMTDTAPVVMNELVGPAKEALGGKYTPSSPADKYKAAVALSPTIIRRATIDPYFAREYITAPPIKGAPSPQFSGFPQPTVEGDDLLAGVILDWKDAERTKYGLGPISTKQQKDKFFAAKKGEEAVAARVTKLAARNYNLLRAGKPFDTEAAAEIAGLTGKMGDTQKQELVSRLRLLYTDKEMKVLFGRDMPVTTAEKLKYKRAEPLWQAR